MSERVAWPNLGADAALIEEGPDPALPEHAAVRRLADAFTSLVEDPPWPWLERARGLVPWLSTMGTKQAALEKRLPLWGPDPTVVQRMHDKVFAAGVARAFLKDEITELVSSLNGYVRLDDEVSDVVSRWPEWARADFVVKPRYGTSGRGRIAGKEGRLLQKPKGKGPLGGWLIEPWLARTVDLSTLWFVDEHGEPHFVGGTRQVLKTAGLYLGCDIVETPHGLGAGTSWDEAAIEGARFAVDTAAAWGFRGPCGIDAFAYIAHDGTERLRPIVEMNARFTAGHVALGLAERARQRGADLAGRVATFRLDRDEVFVLV